MNQTKLYEFLQGRRSLLIAGLTFLTLVFFTSCSSSPESTAYISDENGKETFSFSDDVDGKESQFTAHFDGDKITSIYKDGKKVSEPELEEYSELVYHKLNKLRKGMKEFDDDMVHFSLDMKKFNEEMSAFREKMLAEGLASSKFHFNKKEFKEQMEKLKEELAQLKDKKIEFHFDKEKHEQLMKELQEQLGDLHLKKHDFNFEFDNEEFQKAMEQLKEALKVHDWENMEFNIPIPEIHIDLDDLDKSMKELDTELNKLKSFMSELRTELVNDKLISSEDEDFNMDFSAEKMTIDDKTVPADLHRKYKEIYKKHFGKEIDDKIKIRD